jgi:hypothetical protein
MANIPLWNALKSQYLFGALQIGMNRPGFAGGHMV